MDVILRRSGHESSAISNTNLGVSLRLSLLLSLLLSLAFSRAVKSTRSTFTCL